MSNVKSTIQFALVSALSLAAVSTEAQASGDEEVIITAEIKGKTCGLQWHAHAGGNSAVGAKEHIAKFDCGTTEGDPVFLESGTEKIYTLKQGNKCYLEWAGEKNSVHGIWAEERIAKFDCGGGGDTFQIHGNRGADQFVTTKTSTQTCHFQWVGSSGGAGVGNNEYIAKWDCEAGKSGDPIRIIAKNPVTTTYTLIKSDVECKSRDVSLGYQNTLQDCADACEADSDCDYFVYGKGSKRGACYHEKASSAACSEGWETDKYDFYALVGKPGSTPQPTEDTTSPVVTWTYKAGTTRNSYSGEFIDYLTDEQGNTVQCERQSYRSIGQGDYMWCIRGLSGRVIIKNLPPLQRLILAGHHTDSNANNITELVEIDVYNDRGHFTTIYLNDHRFNSNKDVAMRCPAGTQKMGGYKLGTTFLRLESGSEHLSCLK